MTELDWSSSFSWLVLIICFTVVGLIFWVIKTLLNATIGKKFPKLANEPKKIAKDPGFWLMAVPVGLILLFSLVIIVDSLLT